MVNAIEKAFIILEKIASCGSAALTPAQIADELQLNRATCSRILKQLLDMGYVIKVSRRQGYAAGPRLRTMGNICNYSSQLLKYAIPLVDRCAMELQGSVLISQLCNGRRYVIYHRNCDPEQNITITYPCYDDIFVTATGLLLTAYCSKSERKRCFELQKKYGGIFMDDFSSFEKLNTELDRIRQQGHVEMVRAAQCIYAYPIKCNDQCDTVIGMSILRSRYTAALNAKICRMLEAAVQELSHYSEMKFIIG